MKSRKDTDPQLVLMILYLSVLGLLVLWGTYVNV